MTYPTDEFFQISEVMNALQILSLESSTRVVKLKEENNIRNIENSATCSAKKTVAQLGSTYLYNGVFIPDNIKLVKTT